MSMIPRRFSGLCAASANSFRQPRGRHRRHSDQPAQPVRGDGEEALPYRAAHRVPDHGEALPAEPVGEFHQVEGGLGGRARTDGVLGAAVAPQVDQGVGEGRAVEVREEGCVGGPISEPAVHREHLVGAVAVQLVRECEGGHATKVAHIGEDRQIDVTLFACCMR
jgi:hypothetical protein